jgi:DNA-binding response OmpR family regulator
MKRHKPDLMIIDLGLPDMDGLRLVRQLIDTCQTGVIILSERNSLPDRILGLELGADDYISKPETNFVAGTIAERA